MGYPIRTCFIKGKILKQLIYSNVGVLIFEGHTLKFYNANTLKGRKVDVCPDPYEGKVIFLSNQFDLIKTIDGEESYRLDFHEKYLVLTRVDGGFGTTIEGIRLYP